MRFVHICKPCGLNHSRLMHENRSIGGYTDWYVGEVYPENCYLAHLHKDMEEYKWIENDVVEAPTKFTELEWLLKEKERIQNRINKISGGKQ